MRAYLVGLFVCGAAMGCVSGGDDDAPGRGSAACRDWQDAICDVLQECGSGAITRAQCDNQYQGAVCRDDDDASACSNLFNDATCGSITEAEFNSCDFRVIADPIPARAACEEFNETYCVRALECGMVSDEATCRATSGLDCSAVVIHTLVFEQCLREMRTLSCDDGTPLPEACESVFLQ